MTAGLGRMPCREPATQRETAETKFAPGLQAAVSSHRGPSPPPVGPQQPEVGPGPGGGGLTPPVPAGGGDSGGGTRTRLSSHANVRVRGLSRSVPVNAAWEHPPAPGHAHSTGLCPSPDLGAGLSHHPLAPARAGGEACGHRRRCPRRLAHCTRGGADAHRAYAHAISPTALRGRHSHDPPLTDGKRGVPRGWCLQAEPDGGGPGSEPGCPALGSVSVSVHGHRRVPGTPVSRVP